MEIKISTQNILKALNILSWIIFIGICVEAGGILFNSFFTVAINPIHAKEFWGIDLSDLYRYDRGYFLIETLLMGFVAIMKALLFYLIIKILHPKKLDMSQPFSVEVGRFIFNIAYLALFIGVLSKSGATYAEWFIKQGIKMPDLEYLHLGGADVWLFMGVTLFVIAQIFKRGTEIQAEHELTI